MGIFEAYNQFPEKRGYALSRWSIFGSFSILPKRGRTELFSFDFDERVREKQVKDGNGSKMQDNIVLQVLYVVVYL